MAAKLFAPFWKGLEEAAATLASPRSPRSPRCVQNVDRPLSTYFLQSYLTGQLFEGPQCYMRCSDENVGTSLLHPASGIKISADALDLRAAAPDSSPVILYYYTGRATYLRFSNTLALDVDHFSQWLALQQESPQHAFHTGFLLSGVEPEELFMNSEGASGLGQESMQAGYCIPVLVPRCCVFTISESLVTDDSENENTIELERLRKVGSRRPRRKSSTHKGNASLVPIPEDEAQWSDRPRHGWVIHLGALEIALSREAGFQSKSDLWLERIRYLTRTDGVSHPDTLQSFNRYANIQWLIGRRTEAILWHRRTLVNRASAFGSQHPDTLRSQVNLAVALYGTGQYEEAEALLCKALPDLQEALGAEHPHTLYCLSSLAVTLEATNRYAESERLLRQAFNGCERTYGHSHPQTEDVASDLAVILQKLGREAEAEPLRLRAKHGEAHPWTLYALQRLSDWLDKEGRSDEALEVRSRFALLQDLAIMQVVLNTAGRREEAAQLTQRVLHEGAPAYNLTLGKELEEDMKPLRLAEGLEPYCSEELLDYVDDMMPRLALAAETVAPCCSDELHQYAADANPRLALVADTTAPCCAVGFWKY